MALVGADTAAQQDVVQQKQTTDYSPWAVEDFVIGRIPEDPPPFELCH